MLGLNPSMRFYLCEGPVDMRKGIFTLAELVRKIMGKEPSTGDIFIFLSKDRRNIKIFIMIQGDTCFIGRSWTKTVSSCLFSARPVIVMKSVGRNSWSAPGYCPQRITRRVVRGYRRIDCMRLYI